MFGRNVRPNAHTKCSAGCLANDFLNCLLNCFLNCWLGGKAERQAGMLRHGHSTTCCARCSSHLSLRNVQKDVLSFCSWPKFTKDPKSYTRHIRLSRKFLLDDRKTCFVIMPGSLRNRGCSTWSTRWSFAYDDKGASVQQTNWIYLPIFKLIIYYFCFCLKLECFKFL